MAVAGLIPGYLTLATSTNGCVRISLAFRDSCACQRLDLAGYSAELQVRQYPGAATALLTLISAGPNDNDSAITLTEMTDCSGNAYTSIEVYISNADVASLPLSIDCEPAEFAYDLRLTDTAGDANPYLAGVVVVTQGISL